MDIFDVIGPVMIGPSSSHTAGAVRMGNLVRKLLGDDVSDAEIYLHGSFALTARGHGTDRAIVGGLIGLSPEDGKIVKSFELASESGLSFRFIPFDLGEVHPNTAMIKGRGKRGGEIKLQLSSVGGGKIVLSEIDGVKVRFEGKYPTLIVFNDDVPGVVVSVSTLIAEEGINIVEMRVYNSDDNKSAVMIINMNKPVDDEFILKCRSVREIRKIIYIDKLY